MSERRNGRRCAPTLNLRTNGAMDGLCQAAGALGSAAEGRARTAGRRRKWWWARGLLGWAWAGRRQAGWRESLMGVVVVGETRRLGGWLGWLGRLGGLGRRVCARRERR
jgi:hypothetical protein